MLIHCHQHFAPQKCVGEPTIYIQFIDDSVFQNSYVTENSMHSKDSIHQDRIHFALYRACSMNSHFNL
jgi:hypothetical protein